MGETITFAEYADAAERLSVRVMALEEALAACVAALESIEWYWAPWGSWCPSCEQLEYNGHLDDCQLRRALCTGRLADATLTRPT